jgi:hypothetical protein
MFNFHGLNKSACKMQADLFLGGYLAGCFCGGCGGVLN